MKQWEDGFRKIHPRIEFDDRLPTSDAAVGALVSGVADLAPDGGEVALTERLSFWETFGYHVTEIAVATGSYDVEGRSSGLVVYVHDDNPISQLTVQQLDGIFGAQRTGALRGFKWTLHAARGPERDIRTWGQLGLGGEWAEKPIQTYGHAPSGTARFFQLKVLDNSDKWNPNYRQFVETGSKMIADDDLSQLGGTRHMLEQLANDRYGIAWTIAPQAQGVPGIKPLALAAKEGGPYVVASRDSFQSRTYPLARSVYILLNRAPDQPLDPKLEEFLRYVLSREGQETVARDGNYLPLTAELARKQLPKLE